MQSMVAPPPSTRTHLLLQKHMSYASYTLNVLRDTHVCLVLDKLETFCEDDLLEAVEDLIRFKASCGVVAERFGDVEAEFAFRKIMDGIRPRDTLLLDKIAALEASVLHIGQVQLILPIPRTQHRQARAAKQRLFVNDAMLSLARLRQLLGDVLGSTPFCAHDTVMLLGVHRSLARLYFKSEEAGYIDRFLPCASYCRLTPMSTDPDAPQLDVALVPGSRNLQILKEECVAPVELEPFEEHMTASELLDNPDKPRWSKKKWYQMPPKTSCLIGLRSNNTFVLPPWHHVLNFYVVKQCSELGCARVSKPVPLVNCQHFVCMEHALF